MKLQEHELNEEEAILASIAALKAALLNLAQRRSPALGGAGMQEAGTDALASARRA